MMYKELLKEKNYSFSLDHSPLEINDSIKPYYFELVTAKLRKGHINYQLITKETITQKDESISTRILIDERNFDEVKKDIYMFTKIACSIDYVDDFNAKDFNNVDLALDYSTNLRRRFHEYHLIKKNNFSGYAVHHTFEEYNMNELEKEYEDKVLKKIK